jgi:hypothetical protein
MTLTTGTILTPKINNSNKTTTTLIKTTETIKTTAATSQCDQQH